MKTKSIVSAIVAAALSVVLCVGLLVGTTVAWFTDTVSSTGNSITAGALAVELNDGSSEALFTSDTVWAPGTSQRRSVRVENVGSVALRYSIAARNIVTSGDADLSSALNVYKTATGAEVAEGTLLGTLADLAGNAYGNDGTLAVGASETFDIVIEMPGTVGDEYQNCGVTFDLCVTATQTDAARNRAHNPSHAKENRLRRFACTGVSVRSFSAMAKYSPERDSPKCSARRSNWSALGQTMPRSHLETMSGVDPPARATASCPSPLLLRSAASFLPKRAASKTPVKVCPDTGAPASRSNGTFSAAAISPNSATSGSETPRSHLETVCKCTFSFSANCDWVYPAALRSSFSLSPKPFIRKTSPVVPRSAPKRS